MGLEYAKARQLALRRAYPASFGDDDFDFENGNVRIPRPMSAPGSPRFLSGMMVSLSFSTYLHVYFNIRTNFWFDRSDSWRFGNSY